MKIALHDADKTNFPNLALMKISAKFKKHNHNVMFYDSKLFDQYDEIYSSKVFTFTKTPKPPNAIYGGIGYKNNILLDEETEHICPDYSLYGVNVSYGFLTRGCPRKCPWCVVPTKEGKIRPHADINEFLRHDKAILMDNNVLACDHGIQQIEKIITLGIRVDFNQGLDAQLIDTTIAKLLSKVKWLVPIRLACDTHSQMKSIQKAVTELRWQNTTPTRYSCYAMITNIDEALERVKFLKGLNLDIFAQPYIDYNDKIKPSDEQKDFARWVNHKAIFKSVPWEDYRRRK